MVERGTDDSCISHQLVLERARQFELLENLRTGHLQHVVDVLVVWLGFLIAQNFERLLVLANDLVVGEPALRKLLLVHGLDQKAGELVPLHVAVPIDVDLVEERYEAMDQIYLLRWVLIRDYFLHQLNEFLELKPVLVVLLLGQEPIFEQF